MALLALLAATWACRGGPPSLSDFPGETRAELVGVIEPRDLGPNFGGGQLRQLAADGEGFLYLATTDPCQLLRLAPSGELHWALDGSGGSDGAFAGPLLQLATGAEALFVLDPGRQRLHEIGFAGDPRREVALSAAFDAARAPGGEIFVYPNAQGFLLDVFDVDFRYQRSLLPLPGTPDQVGLLACHLLDDPQGGVFALWNPTRTVYRLGPRGERRGEFTLDPPELVANLERRLQAAEELGRRMGVTATVEPFLDLLRDEEGRLAVLSLHESFPEAGTAQAAAGTRHDAVIYRFTAEGRGVDVIRGLGAIGAAAFGPGGELYGLDMEKNRVGLFRLRAARSVAGG